MALTFTTADLDALKAAFLTGALSVSIGDRTVTYRSQRELLAAIQMVQDVLNGISSDVENNPGTIQAGYARKPAGTE